jgi:hypothetical protein
MAVSTTLFVYFAWNHISFTGIMTSECPGGGYGTMRCLAQRAVCGVAGAASCRRWRRSTMLLLCFAMPPLRLSPRRCVSPLPVVQLAPSCSASGMHCTALLAPQPTRAAPLVPRARTKLRFRRRRMLGGGCNVIIDLGLPILVSYPFDFVQRADAKCTR